ncbi:hypothetical protein E8E11_006182 [Didymella keratinophila]|nr:hypothetical protein E8E11_006182 [Didymella keratinophila]
MSEKTSDPVRINITRLPTDDAEHDGPKEGDNVESRTVLHIYFEHPCQHKTITPIPSPAQERRFGPNPKQQKQRRSVQKSVRKAREATRTFPHLNLADPTPAAQLLLSSETLNPEPSEQQHEEPNDFEPSSLQETSYFLHSPYLSFHSPPKVLYTCPVHPTSPSRYSPSTPVALIHSGCFWRTYTIQLGASLALPGVIDPRGVVSWAHNTPERERDGDERTLKGYKVRGWRLWGESGRAYVHTIASLRASGVEFSDPDASGAEMEGQKVAADEVVTLRWTRPFSRQTRTYTFVFRGMVFKWKGTGTVREDRKCGWMLRFCHLKLVASVPVQAKEKERAEVREVCLGKYMSSIAAEKSGTLEVFDGAVLRFVKVCMPSLLEGNGSGGDKDGEGCEDGSSSIDWLKKGVLYQLIVASALCVASAEKEKRHTLIDLIVGIAENGGNGGG